MGENFLFDIQGIFAQSYESAIARVKTFVLRNLRV